jgi:hypothetical protein
MSSKLVVNFYEGVISGTCIIRNLNLCMYVYICRGGTFGALIEYGVEKKISQLSTVGATMIVGIPHGVMLRLK